MFNENELKISLGEGDYLRLASLTDEKPVRQVNHYFDTGDLSRMLRVRVKNGKYALQFKERVSVKDGVFNSVEQGREVDAAFLRKAMEEGADASFVNGCFGCAFKHNPRYLGFGVTERIKFCFKGFTLELDKTTVDGATDFELECEADDRSIAKLKTLLAEMGIPLAPSEAKSQRFLKIKGLL